MAKKTIDVTDARINRDNNMGGYGMLAAELVEQATGMKRSFGGCTMSYDEYTTTSYRHTHRDCQVSVVMDFNKHTMTITVED